MEGLRMRAMKRRAFLDVGNRCCQQFFSEDFLAADLADASESRPEKLECRIKEEVQGETMSFFEEFHCPQAMKRFEEPAPPPFLTKTYEIVDDPATNHVVSWSRENNSFVVWDIQSFSMHLLPKYFKHNNFSSFVRQLNTYGFRKVDPERWEFANENFLRGETHLLNKIWRRKASSQQQIINQTLDSCAKSGWFERSGEDDTFKREKRALTEELINIKQQNQAFKAYLLTMEDRLRKTETKQTQMMSFLARGLKRSKLLQHIAHPDTTKQLIEENSKKRRCSIYQWPAKFGVAELDQRGETDEKRYVKTENFIRFVEDDYEFLEVTEVDEVAMKMEDLGGRLEDVSEVDVERGGKVSVTRDKDDLDDGFWEELLKGCIKE